MRAVQADSSAQAPVEHIDVHAFEVPTETPESDGTLTWHSTTLIVAHLQAGDSEGMGFGYAGLSAASVARKELAEVLRGRSAWDTGARWADMKRRVRNLGGPGVSAMAVSVLDTALWDWKARRLGIPLANLIGVSRSDVPCYGSGGFTSYSLKQLQSQLADWVADGLGAVKMKVGRHPNDDPARVEAAREAIGARPQLMVDANGAYGVKQAQALAKDYATQGVCWFEEPVSSDDLGGLRWLQQHTPAGMEIAAGEYGHDSAYFLGMLASGAVDVLQVDATRCGGVTGFLKAAAVCEAFGRPLSSHCAPGLHASLIGCAPTARHLEYFHDHVRIENMLFEGGPQLHDGVLQPDLSRPGLGMALKQEEARCFKVM